MDRLSLEGFNLASNSCSCLTYECELSASQVCQNCLQVYLLPIGHGLIIAHVTRGVIYAYQGVHCTYGSLGTKVKIQKGLWSPVFHWVRSKTQKGGGGRSRSSKLKTITLKPTRHWAQTQASRLTCQVQLRLSQHQCILAISIINMYASYYKYLIIYIYRFNIIILYAFFPLINNMNVYQSNEGSGLNMHSELSMLAASCQLSSLLPTTWLCFSKTE